MPCWRRLFTFFSKKNCVSLKIHRYKNRLVAYAMIKVFHIHRFNGSIFLHNFIDLGVSRDVACYFIILLNDTKNFERYFYGTCKTNALNLTLQFVVRYPLIFFQSLACKQGRNNLNFRTVSCLTRVKWIKCKLGNKTRNWHLSYQHFNQEAINFKTDKNAKSWNFD